jgi:hypothetical protein
MGSLLSRGKKAADDDHDDADADHKHDDALKVSPWDGASMKRTVDESVPKVNGASDRPRLRARLACQPGDAGSAAAPLTSAASRLPAAAPTPRRS